MNERTMHVKRIQKLEAALRVFAEFPLEDASGAPVVDVHVNYQGGAGWSMKLAGKVDARKAILSARKLLGMKQSGPKARVR